MLHQMLSIFSTINLVYVLEINIFGRDGIIKISIISCKVFLKKLLLGFFEKTRNGKLSTHNEKLVIMYLSVSQ